MALVAVLPRANAQENFAGFIFGLRDICAQQPARACTKRVRSYFDGNNDGQISLVEFETARAQAKTAVSDRNSGLSGIERNLISVGLLTLQHAKPAAVFASFDADRDGGLSEDELFTDFQLDQRPLAKIIADPKGVDWSAFAARFGKVGFLIRDLLPPSHRN